MKISGIRETSLFDGFGVNFVIFTQGCPHDCRGCHNPSTHNPEGGYEVTVDELMKAIESNKLITGVTFSGGEPLSQFNEVLELAQWCKQNNLQTTLYTGYRLTKMTAFGHNKVELFWTMGYDVKSLAHDLNSFDYIIDSPFDITKKSTECPFRGSTNQRLLKRGVDY